MRAGNSEGERLLREEDSGREGDSGGAGPESAGTHSTTMLYNYNHNVLFFYYLPLLALHLLAIIVASCSFLFLETILTSDKDIACQIATILLF